MTLEAFHQTVEAVKEQPFEPHPCKLGKHLVSATTKKRLAEGDTTARCSICGTLLGPFPPQ